MSNIFGKILTAIQKKRELEAMRLERELLKDLNISKQSVEDGEHLVVSDKFTLGDTSEVVSVKVYKLIGHREAEIKANIEFHERELLPIKDKKTPGE